MFPTLIDLGTRRLPFVGETHVYLPTYGILFAGAVLLAWWWFTRRAREMGLPEEQLFNLTFYTLLGGVLGAKLALILVDWSYYLNHPARLWGTLRSAGVLMGGVIVGAVVFVLYARRHGFPLMRLGDAIAAPLALAQGVGRLGCFAAGCCWGVPADPDHPLAVTFTHPLAHAPLNEPRIATQLIQAGHDLLLAGLLTWLWRRRLRPEGTVFWIYALVYSLGRGTIELWRGDAQRGLYLDGRISTSQVLALIAALFAVLMLLRGRVGSGRAAGRGAGL